MKDNIQIVFEDRPSYRRALNALRKSTSFSNGEILKASARKIEIKADSKEDADYSQIVIKAILKDINYQVVIND